MRLLPEPKCGSTLLVDYEIDIASTVASKICADAK